MMTLTGLVSSFAMGTTIFIGQRIGEKNPREALSHAIAYIRVCGAGGKGVEIAFVMVQGIIGAFCVRVPVSFFMSRIRPVSLFRVGLATPCSIVVQILLCFGCMIYIQKKCVAADGVV